MKGLEQAWQDARKNFVDATDAWQEAIRKDKERKDALQKEIEEAFKAHDEKYINDLLEGDLKLLDPPELDENPVEDMNQWGNIADKMRGTDIAATYGKGSKKSDWFADFEKQIKDYNDNIKPADDPFSRKGRGMGDRWKGSEREKDYSIGGNFVTYSAKKKKNTMAASYKPQGGTLKETTFDRIKKVRKKFDYEGKPTPTDDGYPENPPAELGKDGFHSEYGKNSNRYKKLDPISAKAMARVKTGDPETDAVVQKQAKKKK